MFKNKLFRILKINNLEFQYFVKIETTPCNVNVRYKYIIFICDVDFIASIQTVNKIVDSKKIVLTRLCRMQ